METPSAVKAIGGREMGVASWPLGWGGLDLHTFIPSEGDQAVLDTAIYERNQF